VDDVTEQSLNMLYCPNITLMAKVTHRRSVKRTAASDKGLLEGLRALEPQALSSVHQQYFPELYRYALYRMGDPQQAEDLASETFAQLLSALDRGAGPDRSLRGWLFSTISNLLHDQLRAKYRLPKTTLEQAAADLTQEDPVDHIDASQELRQALEKLTPEQQHVISLRFGGAFSLAETAELMGKNLNAVKALQFRALGALRRHLKQDKR